MNAAYTLSFDVLANANPNEAVEKFRAIEVELPPMGDAATWREMTDEEARDYQKECEEEEREARLVRDSFDDEDDF